MGRQGLLSPGTLEKYNQNQMNCCALQLYHSNELLCYFYFFFNFMYLFLVVLGVRCCAWAFSSCREQGLLLVAVHGLLVGASLVGGHGL